MNNYSSEQAINIGTGEEVSMYEFAEKIKRITGFKGEILTDSTKPDGMMRRLCDSNRIHELGWQAQRTLDEGLLELYEWYLHNETCRKGSDA